MECYISPTEEFSPIRILDNGHAEVYKYRTFVSGAKGWTPWTGYSHTPRQRDLLRRMVQVPDTLFTLLGYNRGN